MKFTIPALTLSIAIALCLPVKGETQDLRGISEVFKSVTFNSLPVVDSDVNFPGDPKLPDIPKFSWKRGDKLAEVFPIGLLRLVGGTSFTPATAAEALGISKVKLLDGKLGNLKFLAHVSIKDLVRTNPQLKDIKLSLIPGWSVSKHLTLGQIASNPFFNNKSLPTSVLNAAKIKLFPGIADTPYFKYPNIGSLPIDRFFGLADIGFDRVFGIAFQSQFEGLQLIKLDKIATQEADIGKSPRDNVSSGSNKEPYAPCEGGQAQVDSQNTCDYVEFQSVLLPGVRDNPLNGTKAVVGQSLKGGHGLLGQVMTAAGVREPAGYEVPYVGIKKCGSKWSAGNLDPRNGTIVQYLNLRICYQTLFGFQASPYFIPIPIGTGAEKDNTQFLPMKVQPQPIVSQVQQLTETVSASDLPDAQKSYIKAAIERIYSSQPDLSPDETMKIAIFSSFSGTYVKTASFNPVLGSSDEIVKSLL